MKRPRESVLCGSPLRDRVFEHQFEAIGGPVKTGYRLSPSPTLHMPVEAVTPYRQRWQKQRIHHPDVGDVPVNLACGFTGVHFCNAATFSRSSGTTSREPPTSPKRQYLKAARSP